MPAYDNSPTIGPSKGTLIIHGGKDATLAKSLLRSLAGGNAAEFVVIPTARTDDDIEKQKSKCKPPAIWMHTRNRDEANSNQFVEPLRRVSGVWIDGGRQPKLVDAYLDTAVEREIKSLLARGGVVGGSSAGASIQGSYLVRGHPGDKNHPDGDNTIMMFPGYEAGFGLLAN